MNTAKNTILMGAEALTTLANSLDESFENAIEIIQNTEGKVVIVGLGKSGLLGSKLAATFASTGTPSFFMHATEAYHGDIGMVTESDTVVLISYSGETDEVIRLIPVFQERGIKTIAIVGKKESTLAKYCDVALLITVEREACPHNLAPTTSSLTTLAMGDALAITLMKRNNFQKEDFAKNHPGGSLGRRLLTRVKDVMHKLPLPVVAEDSNIRDVIVEMTQGRMGIAVVMKGKELRGVITDGDLRRMLLKAESLDTVKAADIMTTTPEVIHENVNLYDAEKIMLEKKITVLLVKDDNSDIVGLLQIYAGEGATA